MVFGNSVAESPAAVARSGGGAVTCIRCTGNSACCLSAPAGQALRAAPRWGLSSEACPLRSIMAQTVARGTDVETLSRINQR